MGSLILVIDDNEDILFNLEITLEANGYQVISAENGKEAIKILKNIKNFPDLILCDILMPEMNGYEFYKVVSENSQWKKIPFIFITAYSPAKNEINANRISEDDILIKPIKKKELLEKISKKIH